MATDGAERKLASADEHDERLFDRELPQHPLGRKAPQQLPASAEPKPIARIRARRVD
jgi:hypothetical protein